MSSAGDLSRRRLLRNTAGAGMAVVVASAVTSCDDDASGDARPPAGASEPEPDPDRRFRAALEAGSERLIQRYAETARRHRELRTALAAYEKRHRRHLAVLTELRERADLARGATPTPTPKPTSTSTKRAEPPVEVAREVGDALDALLGAESETTDEREDMIGEITDPELARVVASIVACGWTHRAELGNVDVLG